MSSNYLNELNHAQELCNDSEYSDCLQYIIQQIMLEIESKTEEKQEVNHSMILDLSNVSIDAISGLYKTALSEPDWKDYCETLANTLGHACTTVGNLCNTEESYEFTKNALTKIASVFQEAITRSFATIVTNSNIDSNLIPSGFHYYFALVKLHVFSEMQQTSSWATLSEEKTEEIDEMSFIDSDLISNQGIETAFTLFETFSNSPILEKKWYAMCNTILFGEQELENLSKTDTRYLDLANLIANAYQTMLKDCKDILYTDFKSKQEEFNEFVRKVKTENTAFIFDFEKELIKDKKAVINTLKEEIPKMEEDFNSKATKDKQEHKNHCIRTGIICFILGCIAGFALHMLKCEIYISFCGFIFFLAVWEIWRRKSIKKHPYASSITYSSRSSEIERKKKTLKEAEDYIKSVEG